MLEFENEEKVIELIMEETRYTEKTATNVIKQIKKLPEELHPLVKAWEKGEKPEFEYKGITLTEIMEKERASYIQAIASMSCLLGESDEEIEFYKKRKFRRL